MRGYDYLTSPLQTKPSDCPLPAVPTPVESETSRAPTLRDSNATAPAASRSNSCSSSDKDDAPISKKKIALGVLVVLVPAGLVVLALKKMLSNASNSDEDKIQTHEIQIGGERHADENAGLGRRDPCVREKTTPVICESTGSGRVENGDVKLETRSVSTRCSRPKSKTPTPRSGSQKKTPAPPAVPPLPATKAEKSTSACPSSPPTPLASQQSCASPAAAAHPRSPATSPAAPSTSATDPPTAMTTSRRATNGRAARRREAEAKARETLSPIIKRVAAEKEEERRQGAKAEKVNECSSAPARSEVLVLVGKLEKQYMIMQGQTWKSSDLQDKLRSAEQLVSSASAPAANDPSVQSLISDIQSWATEQIRIQREGNAATSKKSDAALAQEAFVAGTWVGISNEDE